METFLKKALARHGTKFDYSKVNYKNSRTKVEIICPIHGSFYQMPLNHYRYDCQECSKTKIATAQLKNPADFINQANSIHKEKYNYNEISYKGAHVKIVIICPSHGRFMQTPNSHIRGRGCPKCKQGELHPRHGKSSPACGYYGIYKNNTFRSLSELFWMLSAERFGVEYIGLDQEPNRSQWQVALEINGKKTTYCPDFFIIIKQEVIDIKPKWRIPREKIKLETAEKVYAKKGIKFTIVDADTIAVNYKIVDRLYRSGEIFLYPKSAERLKKRKRL